MWVYGEYCVLRRNIAPKPYMTILHCLANESIWNIQDENMKKLDTSQGQSASELISKKIVQLGDWRGKTLSRMRKLIKEADPDVV